MNRLFDLLLAKPLPHAWLQGLLFTSFTLHMIFVLFTIGTAILAVYYFLDFKWGGRPAELELDRRILRTFLAHKSLAVVLGVAPLLLMQVAYALPFFTAVNLLAPYWLLIIAFLIVAFLSFDILGHGIERRPYVHLAASIIALSFLLLVPGILVAVLITVENPQQWLTMARSGYRLSGALAGHWLFRYLHVLGAALVFGAAFHGFFTARHETGRSSLLKWVVGGLLLQFILGLLLYGSLPERPDGVTLTALFIGVATAALLLWTIFSSVSRGSTVNFQTVFPMLLVILVAMLLTRQFLQNRQLWPLAETLTANAQQYEKALQPYAQAALDRYRAHLPLSYDRPATIFLQSCAFCHGKNADGHGIENKNLMIPAENLTAIRTTRPYLYRIITAGVAGTAMGYFSVYDRYQLDDLMDYLNEKYQVLGPPGPIPAAVSPGAQAQAQATYNQTCAVCHGQDGKGSQLSRGFKPPPPDLSVYSLVPARTFQVISRGYPGTMMPAFGELPQEVTVGPGANGLSQEASAPNGQYPMRASRAHRSKKSFFRRGAPACAP